MLLRLTSLLLLIIGAAMWIIGEGPEQDRVALAQARVEAQREEAGFVTRTDSDVLAIAAPAPSEPKPEPAVVSQPVTVAVETPVPSVTKAAFVSDDVAEQVAEAVQAEVEEIQTELQEKIVLYVTGSSVNVRAGPSTQNAVLGRVRRGDEVELVDYEDNGWAKIRVADLANEVFISGDYLSDTR